MLSGLFVLGPPSLNVWVYPSGEAFIVCRLGNTATVSFHSHFLTCHLLWLLKSMFDRLDPNEFEDHKRSSVIYSFPSIVEAHNIYVARSITQ